MKSIFILALIGVLFSITGCKPDSILGQPSLIDQTITTTQTKTQAPTLISSPSLTPSPTITLTNTPSPTPIGGSDALLLWQIAADENGEYLSKLCIYDLASQKLDLLMTGYMPLDVSPDGRSILLLKGRDLFISELSDVDQVRFLGENVLEAAWLGDSGWIGFIALSAINNRYQVFIVQLDGSDAIQVTNSEIGAAGIYPVFNDGVFWIEGSIKWYDENFFSSYVSNYVWTKLDGTETEIPGFNRVLPGGEFVIVHSYHYNPNENFQVMELSLLELSTGEEKAIIITHPDLDRMEYFHANITPLSDDLWLIYSFTEFDDWPEYWISTDEGNVVSKIPQGNLVVDYVSPSDNNHLLSPDGSWILMVEYSNNYATVQYLLFNVRTSEIITLPTLFAIYDISIGPSVQKEGCDIDIWRYYWIDIP